MPLIYIIFLTAFFGNSFVGYGLIPRHLTLTTEASIYLLFLYSFTATSRRNAAYRFHLTPLFAIFVIGGLCSSLLNGTLNIRLIASLRLLLRFYLFYLALINLNLDEIKLKRINILLFLLFIIQIPTAAIKMFFYGIGEWTIGTYAVFGGGLSAVIPIVALGFLAGYYFFYDSKRVYWLLASGFIFFGIACGKAVLFVLIPGLFIILYYLIYVRDRRVDLITGLFIIVFVAVLSIAVSGIIIKFNPRLNPERKVGGRIDFSYALEFSEKYSMAMDSRKTGYAIGRFSTIMLAFDHVLGKGIGHALFGYGPGSLTKSALDTQNRASPKIYKIAHSYGKTGMVYVLTEYGICGLLVWGLIFFIFCYKSWKWYNYEADPYWKAFSLGSLVFAFFNMFIFFTYNMLPVTGDLLPPVYYYTMATVYLRSKEIA
jgi:hypothetical protein